MPLPHLALASRRCGTCGTNRSLYGFHYPTPGTVYGSRPRRGEFRHGGGISLRRARRLGQTHTKPAWKLQPVTTTLHAPGIRAWLTGAENCRPDGSSDLFCVGFLSGLHAGRPTVPTYCWMRQKPLPPARVPRPACSMPCALLRGVSPPMTATWGSNPRTGRSCARRIDLGFVETYRRVPLLGQPDGRVCRCGARFPSGQHAVRPHWG